jgi:hypothetical protein
MELLKIAIVFYILASLVVIVVLAVMVSRKKEGFKTCVCSSRQGGAAENCQDNDAVEDAYVDGSRTENTDFKSPGWDRGPSPGSYRFPASCGGAPYLEHPNFGSWSEDTLFS